MMKRKTLSVWAFVMLIVFGGTVILYPMIFNSQETQGEEPKATP